MSVTVFPETFDDPLIIGPGQTSSPLTVPETAGGTPPAVYIRVIMLGSGDAPPEAPRPTFRLRAGIGTPVDLVPDSPAVFIRARPEDASPPVGRAQLFIGGEHVYTIRIFIDIPNNTWQLRITNNDDAERQFTWVVADNEPESSQPWLNLPRTLHFDGEVGKAITQALNVRNLGTGDLTISLGGLAEGSKFGLVPPPAEIFPNRSGKLIITFHAPTTPGTAEELYTAKSNDQQATDDKFAHHNNQIRLLATATHPEPPDPCEGFVPFDGGRCRTKKCTCTGFTPNFGPQRCHPAIARKCQRHDCRHDIDAHDPPQ